MGLDVSEWCFGRDEFLDIRMWFIIIKQKLWQIISSTPTLNLAPFTLPLTFLPAKSNLIFTTISISLPVWHPALIMHCPFWPSIIWYAILCRPYYHSYSVLYWAPGTIGSPAACCYPLQCSLSSFILNHIQIHLECSCMHKLLRCSGEVLLPINTNHHNAQVYHICTKAQSIQLTMEVNISSVGPSCQVSRKCMTHLYCITMSVRYVFMTLRSEV